MPTPPCRSGGWATDVGVKPHELRAGLIGRTTVEGRPRTRFDVEAPWYQDTGSFRRSDHDRTEARAAGSEFTLNALAERVVDTRSRRTLFRDLPKVRAVKRPHIKLVNGGDVAASLILGLQVA
jgi:hypothetical protein